MKSVMSPIALAALNKAMEAVRIGPSVRRPAYNSRTADKFVIRGFAELFNELAGIGLHQGRSLNAENIAGVLEALSGYKYSSTMLRVLTDYIGEGLAQKVLSEVPNFHLSQCKTPKSFVLRFPPSVRGTIKNGVAAMVNSSEASETSMNAWMLRALERWVNIQRQQYALLTAIIAMDQARLGQAS
ncbi:DNA-binding protein [Pseudomonas stutzeri]|nr:DNA-binding protein [Stutzerimonas stutzeri]